LLQLKIPLHLTKVIDETFMQSCVHLRPSKFKKLLILSVSGVLC
jgi:hypothetical protein